MLAILISTFLHPCTSGHNKDGSLKTFRMDDERVMAWLKKKVKNVFIWLSTIWKNVDNRRKK